MKITVVTIVALVGCIQARITPKLFSDEHIALINSQATTWVAGRNFPEDTKIEDIKKLLGARKMAKNPLERKLSKGIIGTSMPESFDARLKWSNCTSVSLIRDQSKCGSCWAVAATSVMSDRICTSSNGQKQTQISSEDLIACCETCGDGCEGGYPIEAFLYWKSDGLVSGGEYGTGNGCKPYPFPKCTHHGNSTKYPQCQQNLFPTPECTRKCSNGKINYSRDLNRASVIFRVEGVPDIQEELLDHGPLSASFRVYEDVLNYKSGVYQKTTGSRYVGRHAVRIIGWGVENNVPYWLVANSWNEEWGDNGTFKIRRGNDECGFESEIVGGLP